jgi:uncharacterized membrane protein
VTVNVVTEGASAMVDPSGLQNKTVWTPAYLQVGLSVVAFTTLQGKLLQRWKERHGIITARTDEQRNTLL